MISEPSLLKPSLSAPFFPLKKNQPSQSKIALVHGHCYHLHGLSFPSLTFYSSRTLYHWNKKGKDLKKVNPVLLVIIHDRWSSRPTNLMHNDLLDLQVRPTYSLLTLHGFPSALSSRKSSPLHSSIPTSRCLSISFQNQYSASPPREMKSTRPILHLCLRTSPRTYGAGSGQGSQHCRITASDWIR